MIYIEVHKDTWYFWNLLVCKLLIQDEQAKPVRLGYKKSAISHMHDTREGQTRVSLKDCRAGTLLHDHSL